MKKIRKVMYAFGIMVLIGLGSFVPAYGEYGPGMEEVTEESSGMPSQTSFEPARFVLPGEAKVLVVVEGTEGSQCNVYAYEAGENENNERVWELKFETPGYLGRNGMSDNRTEGDKTTPIGLFQLNTPFGQCDPLEGFPENYIKVTESHIWTEAENRLLPSGSQKGERVGTAGYSGYYDYVLDMGYNKNAVAKKGAALFLHCKYPGRTDTSGCVAIEKDRMAELLRLYGKYGDGCCYIALAPANTFESVYDSYGANNGLSPVRP